MFVFLCLIHVCAFIYAYKYAQHTHTNKLTQHIFWIQLITINRFDNNLQTKKNVRYATKDTVLILSIFLSCFKECFCNNFLEKQTKIQIKKKIFCSVFSRQKDAFVGMLLIANACNQTCSVIKCAIGLLTLKGLCWIDVMWHSHLGVCSICRTFWCNALKRLSDEESFESDTNWDWLLPIGPPGNE